MSCSHCWVSAGAISEKRFPSILTISEYKKVIEDAIDLGVNSISITGGEPLLNARLIDEILNMVSSYRDIYVGIETNGTLISTTLVRMLKKLEGRVIVSISLDYPNPLQHDKFRGYRGAFDAAVNATKLLKEENIIVENIMTVTADNLSYVEKMAELSLEELRADAFKINPCSPTGRAKESVRALSPHDFVTLTEVAKKLVLKYGRRFIPSLPPALIGEWTNPMYCRYRHIAGIMPNGDVSLCAGLAFKGLVAGNVVRERFRIIWETSEFFKALRKLRGEDFEGVCNLCIFRNYCANFCPATAYEVYEKLSAPNPTCQVLYEAGLFPSRYLRTKHRW